MTAPVVQIVVNPSWDQDSAADQVVSFGQGAGGYPQPVPAVPVAPAPLPATPVTYVLEPDRIAYFFAERWGAYIRANYRNLAHVCRVFGVSERAARKWWNGEGGAHGVNVAVASAEHPDQMPHFLYAAE